MKLYVFAFLNKKLAPEIKNVARLHAKLHLPGWVWYHARTGKT